MSALSAIIYGANMEGVGSLSECQMEQCLCPEGRGFFEPRGYWMATADRFPIPGHRGGKYVWDNVRLSHAHCNSIAGGHGASHRETRRMKRLRLETCAPCRELGVCEEHSYVLEGKGR